MLNSTRLLNNQQAHSLSDSIYQSRSIEQSQESIYRFLLDIVKQWPAEAVLQEFEYLFIKPNYLVNAGPNQAISEIVARNNEEEFRSTIKRCCYILVNNWKANKKDRYINQLIQMLANPKKEQSPPIINQLRIFLQNFLNSKDYEELKLFASKCQSQINWSDRYTSNLLVAQSNNLKTPTKQREAAQAQAKQMQYRSKSNLGVYMASSQSGIANKQLKNPTALGDEVLRLIKIIVAKREPSSYTNIANTFVKQTKNINYQQFKQRLHKYLLYSGPDSENVDNTRLDISARLATLHKKYNEQNLTDALLIKTCNSIIDYLTTGNRRTPSQLFISLNTQGNPMALVIVLLKIVLICKLSRNYLEARITELIQYYEGSPEEECRSIINFLEIYNIMFAIYADNLSVKLD